ncbi:hypothetical protein ID866_1230 [Astraeus odoratus]|nr:hypothetical protein ID866_1230 [Astraeus odoratus]
MDIQPATEDAPERPLPTLQFYSVEYPGYVRPSSVHLALRNLGGMSSLENAFKRGAAKNESLLELNFRPGNPYAHPVPGDIVSTSNILLKVTKRRRREASHEETQGDVVGEYTAEAMGVIFKCMADYQFQPDMTDPVAQLQLAMDRMDVDAIRRYKIPDEKEDYILPPGNIPPEIDPQLTEGTGQLASSSRSNLRLFPPPLFSRQGIPQIYNFKANPASMVTTVVNEDTGEERKRLINKGRWKGYGPTVITFSDSNVRILPQPSLIALNLNTRFLKVHKLRSSKPEMRSTKIFWIESYSYWNNVRRSHIFDGITITKETAAFQLCDIEDPMLKEMIEKEEDLREACDEKDGWYSTHALERIKAVLRHKFFSLLQGYIATEEDCNALLEQINGQKKTQTTRSVKRLKYGKHNMAKGALRPEDAAAARLQATLERNAKNLQTTRRGKYVQPPPLSSSSGT